MNQSLAEKYRAKTFGEIIGQENAVQEIRKFLMNFRKVRTKKALLLHGPAGTGKTSLVRSDRREELEDILPARYELKGANPLGGGGNISFAYQFDPFLNAVEVGGLASELVELGGVRDFRFDYPVSEYGEFEKIDPNDEIYKDYDLDRFGHIERLKDLVKRHIESKGLISHWRVDVFIRSCTDLFGEIGDVSEDMGYGEYMASKVAKEMGCKKTIAKKYARLVHCSTKRVMRDFQILIPILRRPPVQKQMQLSDEEKSYLDK